MDIIDRANEIVDITVNAKISLSHAAPPEVEPAGVCLNCSAPVPDGQRWCDGDCRDDWQARRNRKAGRLG
jgi:hypothetical protein